MDIDLLSKMIKEIILDHDEVTLPGVGTFVAEEVPSTFSDKGYTINPPYRRLFFRQREASDTSLVDFYAQSNGLERDAATSILVRFLIELRETLVSRKTIIFPGLGRLRATRENNFFFVPDEDLNIYPEGFGLEPVSLKTHVETEDDFAVAMSSLQSILGDPTEALAAEESQPEAASAEVQVEEPAGMPEPTPELTDVTGFQTEESAQAPIPQAEPEPASAPAAEALPAAETAAEPAVKAAQPVKPAQAAAAQKDKKRRMPLALKVLLWILGSAVLLLGLFILLSRVAPDFTDKLLYTEEELQIIHHQWLK